jgi:gliding motility-associated-like protein
VRVNPVDLTIYTVTVVNEAGCVAVDTVLVRVIKDRPVYAPNAFSPNSDGVNDFFTLYGGPGMQRIQKLQVYSRWGSLVFEANDILPNDPKLGWDGRFMNQEVDPGVFVFRAEVLFADGVSELISGDITVLR